MHQLQSIKNHFPAFANDRQQDCFELYTRVMNYRQCPCCQGQSCRELDRLFGVKFANRLECPGCKNEWLAGEAQQHFLDIGLPAADPQTTTVQALVNKVFCVNKYEYACVGCGKQRKDVNVRQVLIDASPRLVLRLKRWSGDPDMPGRKNRCAVKFTLSEKLTLTQQSSEHLTYVLKSAVIHHGDTIENGQNTSLLYVNGRTYSADDERTQPVGTLKMDHYKQCYMLCYMLC
ncbi:Hypp8414 [Branchiostoma lanceolatum]|uniref:Hypp8414 protein n=1 Tax=Branchiostoma lanceolatum TaxID=7740 RepID=A0A8J9Z7X3_BRALA|nr:Hypp8414 [Branchiostoma lanceolatum]